MRVKSKLQLRAPWLNPAANRQILSVAHTDQWFGRGFIYVQLLRVLSIRVILYAAYPKPLFMHEKRLIVWRRKGTVSFFMVIRFLQQRRLVGAAWLVLTAMLLLMGSFWPAQPIIAQAGITSPANGDAVSGDVVIMGSAVIDPFQKYELHYKLEPSGNDAYIYFAGATTPITNGQLGCLASGRSTRGNIQPSLACGQTRW